MMFSFYVGRTINRYNDFGRQSHHMKKNKNETGLLPNPDTGLAFRWIKDLNMKNKELKSVGS